MSSPTVRHTQFVIQWTCGCFARVKQPICKINQLTPTAEVKNEWSYIPGGNRTSLSFVFITENT